VAVGTDDDVGGVLVTVAVGDGEGLTVHFDCFNRTVEVARVTGQSTGKVVDEATSRAGYDRNPVGRRITAMSIVDTQLPSAIRNCSLSMARCCWSRPPIATDFWRSSNCGWKVCAARCWPGPWRV
jgi:hypothetical protein